MMYSRVVGARRHRLARSLSSLLRSFHTAAFALVLICPSAATASLLAPVHIDGKAWLQPIDFIDHTWQDIAQVCDPIGGVCNGSLGDKDLTGYTWASQEDVGSLYEATIPDFWPGGITSIFIFDNPVIAEFNNFFDVFGFVPTFEAFVLGPLRQLHAYTSAGESIETVFQATAYFAENVYAVSNNGDFQNVNAGHDVGGWFFRAVPLPSTVSLLAMALTFLRLRRWFKPRD